MSLWQSSGRVLAWVTLLFAVGTDFRSAACKHWSDGVESQALYEGNHSGKSFQRVLERKIHIIPFSTARSSQRGRLRPSARRDTFGSSASINTHCSSCNSSRRGITISRYPTGKTVFHINRLLGIFETDSSKFHAARKLQKAHAVIAAAATSWSQHYLNTRLQ